MESKKEGRGEMKITIKCFANLFFVSLILLGCNSRKAEIGNCYYYEEGDTSSFLVITSIDEQGTSRILNLSPVYSEENNELVNGSIIRNGVSGADRNIIWTSSVLVDQLVFNKLHEIKFYKKIILNKEIRTGTGLAANDLVQFKFIDKLMRGGSEERLSLESLK